MINELVESLSEGKIKTKLKKLWVGKSSGFQGEGGACRIGKECPEDLHKLVLVNKI